MIARTTIVDLFYEDGDLHLVISAVALLILVAILITAVLFWRRAAFQRWKVVEVDISLGGIGQLKVRQTNEVVRIAHQAWTELVTRKAALPFDKDHDVISEVYDSWYKLFGELRTLAKTVPAEQLKHGGPAKDLVDVLVKALNRGLRPHLTRWQARYRTWEAEQIERGAGGRSPQELQRTYPDYDELLADLLAVNKQLVEFAEALDSIVQGRSERVSK